MAKDKAPANFDFAGLLTAMGGPRSYTNQFLYGAFPKTAAAYAGVPVAGRGAIPLSQSALTKGAMGVARMGTRRLPLLAGGLQALGGDPIGGVGTAGGGFAGAALGAKLGMPFGPAGVIAGGLIGGGIGGGLGQSATRGLAGIDVNDPLTGPDIRLPIGEDGIPLTQYAKTKKSLKRAMKLEKMRYEQLLPMIEKAKDKQFQRDLITNQMQMAGSLLGNIYTR